MAGSHQQNGCGSQKENESSVSPPGSQFLHYSIFKIYLICLATYLKTRPVILYFYYGAMILCALEQWERAELFLEHAICLPTTRLVFRIYFLK